ncbi:MAG TPA: hypothetical protein VGF15_03790 [Solirubrobacteraceae bacterium]
MTLGEFALGLLRLAAILLPVLITAHGLRVRYLSVQGPLAVLAEAVLALSVLLVGAQALGLFSLDQADALIALFVLIALLSRVLPRRPVGNRDGAPGPDRGEDEPVSPRGLAAISAFAAITMVAGQWLLQTANALGAGMFNFDTLWYHMPFAARFAQTGSVTAIQFTQADPFVAYYPANSELLHAIGIIALHGDFLSPALNLMWLGVALVASWCLGRPWRVAPQTLIAGCLVISLPVLSGTQPGEAFNDTAGLAMLLGAAALLANAPDDSRTLALAGLALGLAAGTKFTFIVPALVLVGATALHGARGRRGRVMMLLGAPAALTGGWWYLRDLIAVGNPLGARLSIGPLVLPGPASPLARASQQTVISEVSHISLWGSRFAPGLDHALGPLWPLVLGACLASVLAAIVLARDPIVRALALTAALTGISYLFLPTGATGLEQGTTQFQVNLRYATPALALCLLLVPILVRLRFTRALAALGPTLALVLVATQLDSLWPTQTARHLVFFLAAAGVLAAGIWIVRLLRERSPLALAAVTVGASLVVCAGAFLLQRHYFDRRYLAGDLTDPGLGHIYRWAQGISHSRIALYGSVEQYPLYGARDTNRVDYLGTRTADGGFRPIDSCQEWRAALNAGRYRYVVLTEAPTAPVPVAWTQSDPATTLVLHPTPEDFIFRVNGRPDPARCA